MLENKVVLLNSAKGSGKDTIGLALQNLYGCELRAFKSSLYECAYPFTKFSSFSDFIYYCTDRELKETKTHLCNFMSPREFLIYVSERIVKPHFGKEFFGKKAVQSITQEDFDKGVVFTDSGFVEEAMPLIKEFGGRNIFVVQFKGQGVEDFGKDSRNFINIRECHTIKMRQTNDYITPEKYAMLIAQEIMKYG